MHTPTHLLISGTLFARPGEKLRNTAAVAGALLPDAPIYVMWVWYKFVMGVEERTIWRQLYWSDGWQAAGAAVNSVPVYAALLVAGLARGWSVLTVFAASALVHLAFDFPFHNDDAHRHFWPFSDWRFHSPLSYWNDAHYGQIVGAAESVLALILVVILWRRFPARWLRLLLVLAVVSYVAVPAYFILLYPD